MSSSPPGSSSSSLGGMSAAAGSKKFRHAILKNLVLGLRKRGAASSSRGMSLHERRDAVRHAADAALASVRGTGPRWSWALAAELSSTQHGRRQRPTSWAAAADDDGHHLVVARPSGQCKSSSPCKTVAAAGCKKMISRRRLRARPKSRATARAAGAVARVMASRRARALREMVPGGRGMVDECTLLGETLDYAASLKAQVDAMQLLLRTLQAPKNPLLKQQQ
ncbi:transcription factor IBH1-like 1 [Miscanthus floridulus]|uniref:transcription factor IBH1-like 1 n=1 Tax=Miscanthus floridulus TaxID=154761 RepID=UPI00345B3648